MASRKKPRRPSPDSGPAARPTEPKRTPSAGESVATADTTPHWKLAIAIVWLVGFCLYFYSFTLPNSNPPVARTTLWANLHILLLDLIAPLPAEGGPPTGVAFLPQRLDLVLTGGLILCAAWSLGQLLLRLLRLREAMTTVERIVFGCALGLSAFSLLTLLFGLAGLLSRTLFCGLFLASFAGEFLLRRRHLRASMVRGNEISTAENGPTRRMLLTCGLIAAPFVWCMLLGSLLPSTDFDVKEYHLQGPKEFFQDGRVHFLRHNVYTSFPFLTEMLSLLAMVARGDWFRGALAGKAVLMCFGPLTALAVYAAGQRWFGGTVGCLAALIHITTPWTYRVSIIAYAEGGLTFFLFMALFAVMRTIEQRDDRQSVIRWAGLAGLLSGSAMACKYPGLVSVVAPLGLAIAVGCGRRSTSTTDPDSPEHTEPRPAATSLQRVLRATVPFAIGVLLAVGPWLVKNTVETGNPVYPLLYSVFSAEDWNAELDAKWKRAHSPDHHRVTDLGVKLMDVTAKSDWLSPLLYGLAALSLLQATSRKRIGWLWCYAGYLFLTWWVLTHRIDRFWVPMIPVISLLAGVGADWSRRSTWTWPRNAVLAVTLLFNLGFITTGLCGYNSYLIDLRQAELIGPSIKLLNDLELSPDQRVLCVGEAAVFDARFQPVYNTVFDESICQAWFSEMPDGFTDKSTPLKAPSVIHEKLRQEGISYVYVNWSEVLRYRETYGYTDFAHPDIFEVLQQTGVLGPNLAKNPGFVPWDSLSEASQQEVERWAPSLQTDYAGQQAYISSQIFPVLP